MEHFHKQPPADFYEYDCAVCNGDYIDCRTHGYIHPFAGSCDGNRFAFPHTHEYTYADSNTNPHPYDIAYTGNLAVRSAGSGAAGER